MTQRRDIEGSSLLKAIVQKSEIAGHLLQGDKILLSEGTIRRESKVDVVEDFKTFLNLLLNESILENLKLLNILYYYHYIKGSKEGNQSRTRERLSERSFVWSNGRMTFFSSPE